MTTRRGLFVVGDGRGLFTVDSDGRVPQVDDIFGRRSARSRGARMRLVAARTFAFQPNRPPDPRTIVATARVFARLRLRHFGQICFRGAGFLVSRVPGFCWPGDALHYWRDCSGELKDEKHGQRSYRIPKVDHFIRCRRSRRHTRFHCPTRRNRRRNQDHPGAPRAGCNAEGTRRICRSRSWGPGVRKARGCI